MRARWANLWDIPQAISFGLANAAKGNLDHRIYSYPTMRIMRAESEDGIAMAYLPMHTAAVLESLGWAPELEAEQKAVAAITATAEIEREAYAAGYREVFFICSDGRTDEFAEKKLGYERVTAMRKRLP
jgi:hypothetical protein